MADTLLKYYNDPSKGRWILVCHIPRREASRCISSAVHRPWGGFLFLFYPISWIKMKKITFCKLKTSLSTYFVYNLQTFRGFCQVIFTTFVANSASKYFFYLPVKTEKPKFFAFLVFLCTTASFIVKFRLPKMWNEARHLGSGRVTGANQNKRKSLFTDLVNTNRK